MLLDLPIEAVGQSFMGAPPTGPLDVLSDQKRIGTLVIGAVRQFRRSQRPVELVCKAIRHFSVASQGTSPR